MKEKITKINLIRIAVNAILIILKIYIGYTSGALIILIDALKDITNVLSIINVNTNINYFNKEYLTDIVSLGFVMIINLIGIYSTTLAFHSIVNPLVIDYNIDIVFITIILVLVKLIIGHHLYNKGTYLDSSYLIEASNDEIFDSIILGFILVSITINYSFKFSIDGYIILFISFMIFFEAYKIAKKYKEKG